MKTISSTYRHKQYLKRDQSDKRINNLSGNDKKQVFYYEGTKKQNGVWTKYLGAVQEPNYALL